ncbi:MAG TPA: protoporphyrinogen oxidase [Acidobacteriaceae bacterium]|nr:protoporphyrinogen oxidase [Acidobacteriaceae bacterium]
MRIAIIGGGIAGLAAAYELELARAAGQPVEYALFEAGPRLGGVIASSVMDGTVIERGPDSFLTEKPAAAQLCRELGLGDQLMPSNDAERKTYILVRNRLVALPDGLMFLIPTKILPTVLTGLFSVWTKLRMGFELLQKPRAAGGDESVAALVRRHYGQQAVDRLADPLLSGIYGGDAEQLSAQSVLPRLVEMEAKYGSLTRGMLAGLRARREAAAQGEPRPAPPVFTTLRGGLQRMIDALVERLDPGRLHCNAPIQAIEKSAAGWRVSAVAEQREGETEIYDAVIVATPAWAAAEMLREADAGLSEELAAIPYSSSVTVNLVYSGWDLDPLPPGFGFLVPAVERRAMLACTFIHRKFPGRTAPGKTVLRAFLGGAHNAHLLERTNEEIEVIVRRELFEILAISADPEMVGVQRWPRAMAQYAVGHKGRMERIQARLKELPGLRLVGNAYDGIGISDCIRLGRKAAAELASRPLGSRPLSHPAIDQLHR